MKKLNEKVIELNALRAQLGKKPLAGWKGSNEDLSKALTITRRAVAELSTDEGQPTKAAKKIANSQAKDVATLKAADNKDRFGGINPKVARAKLRKMFGKDWASKSTEEILKALKKA